MCDYDNGMNLGNFGYGDRGRHKHGPSGFEKTLFDITIGLNAFASGVELAKQGYTDNDCLFDYGYGRNPFGDCGRSMHMDNGFDEGCRPMPPFGHHRRPMDYDYNMGNALRNSIDLGYRSPSFNGLDRELDDNQYRQSEYSDNSLLRALSTISALPKIGASKDSSAQAVSKSSSATADAITGATTGAAASTASPSTTPTYKKSELDGTAYREGEKVTRENGKAIKTYDEQEQNGQTYKVREYIGMVDNQAHLIAQYYSKNEKTGKYDFVRQDAIEQKEDTSDGTINESHYVMAFGKDGKLSVSDTASKTLVIDKKDGTIKDTLFSEGVPQQVKDSSHADKKTDSAKPKQIAKEIESLNQKIADSHAKIDKIDELIAKIKNRAPKSMTLMGTSAVPLYSDKDKKDINDLALRKKQLNDEIPKLEQTLNEKTIAQAGADIDKEKASI